MAPRGGSTRQPIRGDKHRNHSTDPQLYPRPDRQVPWREFLETQSFLLEAHWKMMTVAEECCPKDSSGKITLGNYLEYTQTMLRALKQVKVHLESPNDCVNQVALGPALLDLHKSFSACHAECPTGSANGDVRLYGVRDDSLNKKLHNLKDDQCRLPHADVRTARVSSQIGHDDMSQNGFAFQNAANGFRQVARDLTPVRKSRGSGTQNHDATTNYKTKRPRSPVEDAAAISSDYVLPNASNFKRARIEVEKSLPPGMDELPEFEDDVYAEIEARIRAKEETRTEKEHRKRKRDSDASTTEINVGTSIADSLCRPKFLAKTSALNEQSGTGNHHQGGNGINWQVANDAYQNKEQNVKPGGNHETANEGVPKLTERAGKRARKKRKKEKTRRS